MKVLKLFLVAVFAAILLATLSRPTKVSGQAATEAPQNFDNTNGFEPQGDPNTPNTFLGDKATFEVRDFVANGLGPVYNAQSCAECHQNRATGGVSQIFEMRAGHSGPDGTFVEAPGGSLINDRAVNTKIQERVPDGARITYVNTSGQISVMGWDGGQYGPVGNAPMVGSFPAFSFDGKRLAFSSGGNIWITNNDLTNPNQMTITGQDFEPTWAPDGHTLAFSRITGGVAQIFTITEFGQNETNISNNPIVNDRQPAYSPDGTKIAFQRTPNAINPMGRIWTMNSNGSGQMQVTVGLSGNDERPSYSPDNVNIAFSTNRDGNFEIYKTPAIGGVATRLTNNAASDRYPTWAADNSAIAFASNRDGSMNVWAVATDGSTPTELSPPGNGGGDQPAYSRDSGETVRTFRASLNLFGDGFVEAINDPTLVTIRNNQPVAMRGTAIQVDILEAPDQTRIGRFGWKNQHASLLSFSSDAYLNEIGITNKFNLSENTSLGRNVTPFDAVADNAPCVSNPSINCGEDPEEDIEAFTRFMRSLSAPTRDNTSVTNDATDPGSALFDSLSCSVCHVRSITTAPVGSVINGGTFVVPAALGNKVIHPFGDFLLHDIGTGDGIVQNGGEATRNMVRTAPLWGVRTHSRLMHDGGSSSAPTNSGAQSFTFNEAILRHAGQATSSRTSYQALTVLQKAQLIRFLKSL
jgi:CxxC motif-containing protein (DUF1111 family)